MIFHEKIKKKQNHLKNRKILRNINVDTYHNLLEISDDNNFQIHMGSSPNSCFVNNYFKIGLKACETNMNIQRPFGNLGIGISA